MGEAIMTSARGGIGGSGGKYKLQTRIFTSNGTFVVPGNVKNNTFKVMCYGGGGSSDGYCGGGGGGGGYGGKGASASLIRNISQGGGGGGYGPSNYGAGGGGTAINGLNGKSGICIIQYYELQL